MKPAVIPQNQKNSASKRKTSVNCSRADHSKFSFLPSNMTAKENMSDDKVTGEPWSSSSLYSGLIFAPTAFLSKPLSFINLWSSSVFIPDMSIFSMISPLSPFSVNSGFRPKIKVIFRFS